MEPRIQYAKTSDGVNIAYAQFSEGVPLVYAPGAYGLAVHYYSELAYSRGNVDSLVAKGFRVIRYDGRGVGSSDRDNLDYSLDTSVLDLEAVIERLRLDRFVLAGHFHSARAAIAYTVRHPERVTHLVLRDPAVAKGDMGTILGTSSILEAMLPLAAEQWELVSLNAAAIGFGITDLAVTMEYAKAIRSGMTVESFVAQQKALASADASDLLGSLQVPTLVVVDKAFPGRSADPAARWSVAVKKIAAATPDARLETTDDFAAAVAAFVQVNKIAIPGGFRTVLFTDLVGHTEMMQRLGDEAGRAVLREHERITREVLKANGGTEVKTMGDGFMASFGSVTKAVECAIALQKAMVALTPDPSPASAGKGQSVGPLQIRCGLNAGEPIEEDGDLFGATVILASRIAAKADGGEILVADTVRGLCSGKGFLFADRGEFVAKGFEEPVRVYEVSWRS